MKVLGVSAFYHDSAAALVDDGRIIAAVQEERFTRKKHDSSFPENAIRYCLEAGGIELQDIEHVVFYDKPFLKFERLLETYLAYVPKGFASFRMAMPIWIKEKLFQKSLLKNEFSKLDDSIDWEERLLFSEHHVSHAASAFYPSPFEEALVLTMDGVGADDVIHQISPNLPGVISQTVGERSRCRLQQDHRRRDCRCVQKDDFRGVQTTFIRFGVHDSHARCAVRLWIVFD